MFAEPDGLKIRQRRSCFPGKSIVGGPSSSERRERQREREKGGEVSEKDCSLRNLCRKRVEDRFLTSTVPILGGDQPRRFFSPVARWWTWRSLRRTGGLQVDELSSELVLVLARVLSERWDVPIEGVERGRQLLRWYSVSLDVFLGLGDLALISGGKSMAVDQHDRAVVNTNTRPHQ